MTPHDFNNLGNDFQRQGSFDRAQHAYEQAIRLSPNYLPAMANLATILATQEKFATATAILQRIVNITPEEPDQWLALGLAQMRQGKLVECMPALVKALELRPENPDIHGALSAVAYRKRDYATAERLLNHVISLGQTHHSVYYDLAHSKLGQGDLASGLELYEYRWNTMSHGPAWDFNIPEWTGQELTDKHLLVHAEQGFGDIIMVSRFVNCLPDCEVTFAVPPSMIDLFNAQFWGVNLIDINELPEQSNEIYDFHTPMFSMMRHLGINKNDIDPRPYLDPPKDSGIVVPKYGMFNVGICWASGNHRNRQANSRRRATDLELWLPLAEHRNVQLWSLQKDTGTQDINNLGAAGLINDLMGEVDSWGDTASLISQLDLVISVDTGVVHLAGALGVPCWMLSQQSPCWRWWNIENGNGRPWYEDLEIIWSKKADGWKDMLLDAWRDLGCVSQGLAKVRFFSETQEGA